MTWYASQIMTTGVPSVLAAIQRNPLFTDHTFLVTNPIHHDWHTPEVKHSVPDDGLIFIRPICDPTDHIAEWCGDEMLSWERFEHASGQDLRLTPLAISLRHPEFDLRCFTDANILRVAKKLHTDTGVPVAFYYCFFWGGDVENEYAWIFDDSERVLVRQTDCAAPTVNRLLEIDSDTDIVHDDDVLVRTLRSLGCELPTPFFAPHTRSFRWDQHRLRSQRMG